MWLLTNNDNQKFLCELTNDALELMEKNSGLVWTSEYIKVYVPDHKKYDPDNPEVTISVEDRISKALRNTQAIPLGRSGDTE